MFKKADVLTRPTPARQDAPFHGRSERRGEAHSGYSLLFLMQRVQSVEVLSDARTKLADFFNILLLPFQRE
jgi:hypothetical protein